MGDAVVLAVVGYPENAIYADVRNLTSRLFADGESPRLQFVPTLSPALEHGIPALPGYT